MTIIMCTQDGQQPIHYAVKSGKVDVIKTLINDCGVNPNSTNNGVSVLAKYDMCLTCFSMHLPLY